MAKRRRSRKSGGACKIVARRIKGVGMRYQYGPGCKKAGQFAKGKPTAKRRRKSRKSR